MWPPAKSEHLEATTPSSNEPDCGAPPSAPGQSRGPVIPSKAPLELCSRLVTGGLSTAAVSFIFDRQDEFRGRACEIFESIKGDRSTLHYKARLGTLTFSDRKEAAPLQAADFLAYECYKWLDKTQHGLSPPRWQWEMLNRGGRISGYEFEAGSIKRLVERQGGTPVRRRSRFDPAIT